MKKSKRSAAPNPESRKLAYLLRHRPFHVAPVQFKYLIVGTRTCRRLALASSALLNAYKPENLQFFAFPVNGYEENHHLHRPGRGVMHAIGAVELVLLAAFVLGPMKWYTYGAVLLLHVISTFSSCKQYLAPYSGPNILFFAAWPILGACLALSLLRDRDTVLTLGK